MLFSSFSNWFARRRPNDAESNESEFSELLPISTTTTRELNEALELRQIALDRSQELETQLAAATRELDTTRRGMDESRSEASKWYQEAQHFQRLQRQTKELLDHRTTELRGAEAYLSTIDERAALDVQNLLLALNHDILSFAAGLAEEVEFNPPSSSLSSDPFDRARHERWRAIEIVLSTHDQSEDPTLLQLALQHCLCQYLANVASIFCLGISSQAEKLLSIAYACLQTSEIQPVAARWRALTHRSLNVIFQTEVEHAADKLASDILQDIALVLRASRCSKTPHETAMFLSGYKARIVNLIETTASLSSDIKQRVLSTDYTIHAFPSGVSYDPSEMGDFIEEDEAGPDFDQPYVRTSLVLCTVELGLSMITRMPIQDQVLLRSPGSEIADPRGRMWLVKPKVLLDKSIDLFD